jgi:CRP-like cAMP-binding protein
VLVSRGKTVSSHQEAIMQSHGTVLREISKSSGGQSGQNGHPFPTAKGRLIETGSRTAPVHPEPFMSSIGPGKTVLTCRTGHMIFSQGAPADFVFYLQTGRVKLTVGSPQGKEAVVAILEQDSFFGEACLAGQQTSFSTAVALDPCTMVRIDKGVMTRALQREPALAGRFMGYLLARSIRTEEDLADQLLNSSEQRLARTLLLLAKDRKEGELKPVIPKISQETLAEMIGTTRSRVSYFMNKFKTLGYITYHGTFNSGIQVRPSLIEVVRQD